MAQGMTELMNVNSLELAYLGDAFYELKVREYAFSLYGESNVNEMNRCAKEFSKASAQALMSELLLDEMSEKELRVFKRGRNVKSISAPKTCTVSEYRRATGLEALVGFLFLEGNGARAEELIKKGIERLETEWRKS